MSSSNRRADTKVEVKEEEDAKKSVKNGDSKKHVSSTKDRSSRHDDVKTEAMVEEKIEDRGATAEKWWEKERDSNDQTKWQYLEHKGVIFPPFYKPHKKRVTYDGKTVELTPVQEEYATYWAQSLNTDYMTKEHYVNNFTKEFLGLFDKKLGYKDLKKFNFEEIVTYLNEQKEIKKNKTPEEKKKLKDEKAQKDHYYGLAIVDNDLEKVGGYSIEPPTLFKGRGIHPKAGMMKARIMPEEITINIAERGPVPKCDVPGHCWKDIIHNNEVTWLASYRDDTINTSYKYIFLSATSKFKGLNDRAKYEKARRLKIHVDQIRRDYRDKMNSKSKADRQLSTATYLIDKLALRVGNEKSEDEADTVGCCSLRVEHIELLPNNQVKFDFLGKDSMRYLNTVTVDEAVWNNLSVFVKGKKPDDDLFDQINVSTLNDYLRSQMEGLTAKVFRTYNASITLQKELDKKDVSNLDLDQKLEFYDYANRQVAILCNHQRTVSKNFDVQKGKLQDKIDTIKEYIKYLKHHGAKLKKGEKGYTEEEFERHLKKKEREKEAKASLEDNNKTEAEKKKEKKEEEKKKEKDKKKEKKEAWKFPTSTEKVKALIEKTEKKVAKEEIKLSQKEENKAIALGTSKLNYNDPRITVAWCKKNEVPIERVFPKTMRGKFIWAMYADSDFKF